MDTGLLVGIVWIFGQVFLVLLLLYIVVRLAVKHSLRAFYRHKQDEMDKITPPVE